MLRIQIYLLITFLSTNNLIPLILREIEWLLGKYSINLNEFEYSAHSMWSHYLNISYFIDFHILNELQSHFVPPSAMPLAITYAGSYLSNEYLASEVKHNNIDEV